MVFCSLYPSAPLPLKFASEASYRARLSLGEEESTVS
jgi:hypothetical protein